MKVHKLLVLAGIILLTTACSSTTIVPQAGNMFIISRLDATAGKSQYAAMAKAEDICKQQSGIVKVMDQDTVYQGIDSSQQALVNLANKVLPNDKTVGPYFPENHAYKTTLTFKCE